MAQFTDVFEDVTKKGRKIPTSEYLKDGKHPIIDQGQNQIAGYTDEEEGLFEDVPAIVFGDHTRVLKYVDTPCFLGADGVKLLKAKISGVDYKYLYYALMGVRIPDTGYNRHFKWMKEASICLPLLNEQRKISATLDKINTLIDKRRQQLETLDTLAKSQFIEMFGEPIENPYNWDKCSLEALSTKITDGVHAKPQYTESGMPFISVTNMNQGTLDFENCKYVSEEDYRKMIRTTFPEKGDVLYTKVGATYGIPAYVDTDKPFCLYVSVCLIKPRHDLIDARFLTESLRMPYIKKQADDRIKGIGVPDLHLKEIRSFEIIYPPLNMQKKFTEFVEKIDETKDSIQKSLEQLEILKKALMQKYFG